MQKNPYHHIYHLTGVNPSIIVVAAIIAIDILIVISIFNLLVIAIINLMIISMPMPWPIPSGLSNMTGSVMQKGPRPRAVLVMHSPRDKTQYRRPQPPSAVFQKQGFR